jgi:hypothetical protein
MLITTLVNVDPGNGQCSTLALKSFVTFRRLNAFVNIDHKGHTVTYVFTTMYNGRVRSFKTIVCSLS